MRVNTCYRNKNTLRKTRDIFDVNMFKKGGSMGFKSSDLYICYREETHSDNTSLYLTFSLPYMTEISVVIRQ